MKNPVIVLAGVAALMILAVCHAAAGEIQLTKEGEVGSFAISPDGKRIIFDKKRGDPNLLLMTFENERTTIISPPANRKWHSARWSPDGERVAVMSAGYTNRIYDLNDMQIATVDIASGSSQTLTSGSGVRIYPFFSSDGKSVFYFKGRVRTSGRTPAAEYDLYKVDIADGSEQRLTNQEFFQVTAGDSLPGTDVVVFGGDFGKDFSASERAKSWLAPVEKSNRLYLYYVRDKRLETIVTGLFESSSPRFSRDGNIYFVGAENKRGRFHFGIFKFALVQAITSKVLDVVPNPIDFDVYSNGDTFYVKGQSQNTGSLERIHLPSPGNT